MYGPLNIKISSYVLSCLKYKLLHQIFLLFYMEVKLGFSYTEKGIHWGGWG